MSVKKFFLLLLFSGLVYNAYSQQDDFCDAVTTIIGDAPNAFRNIRGKALGSNLNASMWACGIKVPGTVSSRFVSSMGLFYEGAFFQTKNKAEVKAYYDKYKDKLIACLKQLGYEVSFTQNFYPGLDEYKKVVLIKEVKADAKPEQVPPHVTMEVAYNKDAMNYTVVMYIFNH